jgi:hypothetical protein
MFLTGADYAIAAAATRDVRYHSISSLTLLVWHSFVTFDDEVQYIWAHVTSLVVIQAAS